MYVKVASIGWLTIIPTIMSLLLLFTGVYLTVLIIKSLIIYIKNNS